VLNSSTVSGVAGQLQGTSQQTWIGFDCVFVLRVATGILHVVTQGILDGASRLVRLEAEVDAQRSLAIEHRGIGRPVEKLLQEVSTPGLVGFRVRGSVNQVRLVAGALVDDDPSKGIVSDPTLYDERLFHTIFNRERLDASGGELGDPPLE
jgi:hypothetical protein